MQQRGNGHEFGARYRPRQQMQQAGLARVGGVPRRPSRLYGEGMARAARSSIRALRPVASCGAYTAARRTQDQKGFSLIEVSIVTAIVLLIAVIGIPAISSYVMENKVPKVGQELARFVMHVRVNAGTSTVTPYRDIDTSSLATMVSDSTVLTLSGTDTVLHGLGGAGTVEVAATEGGLGFVLRLNEVNHVACPSIASVLQRVADRILVGSSEQALQPVKDVNVSYSALAASAACARGNVNQFEFHVR